jgi:hypothetical protein
MNVVEISTANQRIALLSADAPSLNDPAAAKDRIKLRDQILELSRKNLQLTQELIDYCPNIVDRLAPLAAKVTLALRRELNLTVDADWYRELQSRNLQLNESRSKELMETMQKNLATIQTNRPPF